MSGDPEQEYFSDGISEDIITDLSKLSELHVIARNSTFTYKGKPVDVKQVGRDLGVRYVLEGSVRKAGNRVRVTGQLIDAASGAHIWADRFDRDLTDIFAVQDELTQEIIAALKIKLSEREKALITGSGTNERGCPRLFSEGSRVDIRPQKRSRDVRSIDRLFPARHRARSELCRALRGPGYGVHIGLSEPLERYARELIRPGRAFGRASRSRKTTKILSPILSPPQLPCGRRIMRDGPVRPTEPCRSIPTTRSRINSRGMVHIYTGEPAKAIPYIERAIRLDPAQHLYKHFLGTAYFVAGNYETAAAVFKERIALTPKTDLSRSFLASALGHLGRPDEARQVWRELKEINPRYSYADHFSRLPFKNPADADKFTDGLRKAGLAE